VQFLFSGESRTKDRQRWLPTWVPLSGGGTAPSRHPIGVEQRGYRPTTTGSEVSRGTFLLQRVKKGAAYKDPCHAQVLLQMDAIRRQLT
jgi:hypothetical protein